MYYHEILIMSPGSLVQLSRTSKVLLETLDTLPPNHGEYTSLMSHRQT